MTDDTSNEKTLPPYPDVLYPWSEADKEQLLFKGDKDDLLDRLKFKLYNFWLLWTDLRNNEKLIDIISKVDDTEDKNFFYLKNLIVNTIDRSGKILCNTDLIQELIQSNDNNV